MTRHKRWLPVLPFLVAAGALLVCLPAQGSGPDDHEGRHEEGRHEEGRHGEERHHATATAAIPPLERPAIISSRASHSVLLAATRAGQRIVVVGERGIVLLSDDGAKTWRQARVPVSVTLTAVQFPGEKVGYAVGHFGVVLRTDDGGESWTLLFDGTRAAKLADESAKALASTKQADAALQQLAAATARLVADGPDKPFLDLLFESETAGTVVGAYNLIFRTEDGGKTWTSWMDRIENPKGNHLYALREVKGALYLAGEQGLFLRSDDRGQSWKRLTTPYNGSFFTAAAYPDGTLVVAGLRGNAFATADQGKTWRKIEGPPVNITALAPAGDTLLATNFAGMILEIPNGSPGVKPLPIPALPPLTSLLPQRDGSLLVLSLQGAIPLPAPGAAAANQAGGH